MTDWESTASDSLRTADGGTLVSRRVEVLVLDGPDRGATAELERGTLVIGSSSAADLVLRDPKVSRTHLEIASVGGGVRVRDLGSTNGTFLGSLRVEALILRNASELRVGQTRVAVGWKDEPVEIPASRRTSFGTLVGESVAMRRVFALLDRLSATDTAVLLEGEAGTGKTEAATALHAASPRSERTPQTLAVRDLTRPEEIEAAFAAAEGSTLIIDDLDLVDIRLTPTLLAQLERRERGEIDVRPISTARSDLVAAVAAGDFRRDLFDHLACVRVRLPALRERPEDVPLLLQALAARLGARGPALPADTLQALRPDTLAQNVRDLARIVEEALSLDPGRLAGADARASARLGPEALPFKEAKRLVIETFGREYVRRLLQAHDGSILEAAKAAGLDRHHFADLARRWGVRE